MSELQGQSMGEQFSVLARRSIVRSFRQPVVITPVLAFPLFFLAVNAAGLKSATDIPNFPTDNYLTFALATAFIQVGMSSVSISGGGLAEDIQSGFLKRLSLTKMRGTALVLGHLAGTGVMAVLSSILYIIVALIFGASIKAGVAGGVVCILLALLVALAFGSIGIMAALRTGSTQAVQVVFPLLFVLLFFSSQSIPRNLIDQDWFRHVATVNPMSYLVEAPRSLIIKGWDAQALIKGVLIAAAILALTMSFAGGAMRQGFKER